MSDTIEFQKVVDILDEGIMQLSLYKKSNFYPAVIKSEIISILDFIKKAQTAEYEELLFDKRVTIDYKNLSSISERLHKIDLNEDDIQLAIDYLEEIDKEVLTLDKVQALEAILMNLSVPIWHSISIEEENE
jgi:hypothetical protein